MEVSGKSRPEGKAGKEKGKAKGKGLGKEGLKGKKEGPGPERATGTPRISKGAPSEGYNGQEKGRMKGREKGKAKGPGKGRGVAGNQGISKNGSTMFERH